MLTVKDLMQSAVESSPDGKHWEPAIPEYQWLRIRIRDAMAVLRGEAVAVRQTTEADLTKDHP